MDDEGIEPTTLSMRSSRSTNWARRPWFAYLDHLWFIPYMLYSWQCFDRFETLSIKSSAHTHHAWDIRLLEIHFVASNGVATIFGSDSSSGEGSCWGEINQEIFWRLSSPIMIRSALVGRRVHRHETEYALALEGPELGQFSISYIKNSKLTEE